jgi:hypothetical protein
MNKTHHLSCRHAVRRMAKGAVIIALPLLLAGCSMNDLFSTGPSEEEKDQFLAELNRENLTTRERCFRIYRFDKKWARSIWDCQSLADSLDQLHAADPKTITVESKPSHESIKESDDFKIEPAKKP